MIDTQLTLKHVNARGHDGRTQPQPKEAGLLFLHPPIISTLQLFDGFRRIWLDDSHIHPVNGFYDLASPTSMQDVMTKRISRVCYDIRSSGGRF